MLCPFRSGLFGKFYTLAVLVCIGTLALPTRGFGQERKIAFVVGVSEYAKAGISNLKYADDDAIELAARLRAAGFEVTKRIQDEATKDNLVVGLKELFEESKELNKDDVLLIYFAGHGLQRTVLADSPEGAIQVEAPFFCPQDCQRNDTSTLLSIDEILVQVVKNSGCENNLLLIDACRDNSDRGLDGSGYLRIPRNTSIFWACSPGQKSRETAQLKHGVFTHFLLKGLEGAAVNSRGNVDWLRLVAYVRNEVEHETPLLFPDEEIEQKPNLVGDLTDSPVLRQSSIQELPPLLVAPFSSKVAKNSRAAWSDVLKRSETMTNSIQMDLVLIPPGRFLMGTSADEIERNDELQHPVQISRPFYCSATEVTQSQWASIMGTRPWIDQDFTENRPENPAVWISWEEARDFCRALSQQEGATYRLPTEAEWEYCCRAGRPSPYYSGTVDQLALFAWFKGNAWDQDRTFGQTVGQKLPNSFGLFDMHGNVAEYCSDYYSSQFYSVSELEDPRGANVGQRRVVRGGSFANQAVDCRSARRSKAARTRSPTVGFRVVRELIW